jgi:SAM-dependent methyltransferase
MMPHSESDLRRIYSQRFSSNLDYRKKVWEVLVHSFFQKYIPANSSVLDLGSGYGEFINHVQAKQKFAMDLNPDTAQYLASNIRFIKQNCAESWSIDKESLDIIFTSNFFEHLPDKIAWVEHLTRVSGHYVRAGV